MPLTALLESRLLPTQPCPTQIAGWLQQQLEPKGVGVVLEGDHLCMSLRGVRATGTCTAAVHGLLRHDARSRQEFFALTGAGR